MNPLLSLKNIAARPGHRFLFRYLNLELQTGQIWQIQGPNGCGKTSLLRIAAGLLTPEEGQVCWHGTDEQLPLHYVGHIAGVKAELTVQENLAWACHLQGAKVQPLQIDYVLMRLDLQPQAQQLCQTLSAGQRRRVALARLLLQPARVWLLDEPFTALDALGRAKIVELITEQVQAGGAVMLSSHHAIELPTQLSSHCLELGC